MQYSPIILFVYNRADHTRQTLDALSKAELSDRSHLIIFADGQKKDATEEQLAKISQTRAVLKEKNWCSTVEIRESEVNKGLARNIIEGVTEIVSKYGSVIVLEDDIVVGKHFLEYMNTALDKYKDNKDVFHITGWRDPIRTRKNDSAFFYPTMDCWGWATWADRWQYFKKDATYYKSIFTDKMIWELNVEGTDSGMWEQVEMNLSGKINTWAIFWEISIYLKNGLCLAPVKSLVKNVGFDNSGVHCGQNEAQTITDSIDWHITKYPEKIIIDRHEFNKNKSFNIKKTKGKFNFIFFVKSHIPQFIKQPIKKLLKR